MTLPTLLMLLLSPYCLVETVLVDLSLAYVACAPETTSIISRVIAA